MGLFKKLSGSIYDKPCCKVNVVVENKLPNPDPKNYRILNYQYFGKFLLLEVNYPDATNFEGNKILLFRDSKIEDLQKQGSIDPHFSNNKNFHSPIVRFEPSHYGRELAVKTARMLALE